MDGVTVGSSTLSIDSEEFTRLQTQLIELRTTNYQLKEEKAKAHKEFLLAQDAQHNALKDLEKANKTIQRSKKAKEYQLLLEERDSLLNRLHTQEEDFKLQNKTLLDEIAIVCEQNNGLKKTIKAHNGEGVHTPELVRLKAENAALQKSLQASQHGETNGSVAVSETSDFGSGEIASLRLTIATLEEEKKLLHEQISSMIEKEEDFAAKMEGQSKDIGRQTEKLKKKQESVLQLQEEKENLILKHRQSYDSLSHNKDLIIANLEADLKAYQLQSGEINEASKRIRELQNEVSILKTEKSELQLKFNSQSEMLLVVTQEKDDGKHLLNEICLEMETTKKQLHYEISAHKQCQAVLAEAKQASDTLADQLLALREDKMKIEEEIGSVSKLAESRKTLLDGMAIKEQESVSIQKKKNDELIAKYQSEVDGLLSRLEEEKSRNEELSINVSEIADLRIKLQKYETMKGSHEDTIQKLQEMFEREKLQLQNNIEQLNSCHNDETKSMREKLEMFETEHKELLEKLHALEEDLNEKTSNVKIVEKKSSALIKDLKRQLQQFQRREEKLQHQLLEIRGAESSGIILPSPDVSKPSHSRDSSSSSMKGSADVSISSTIPNASFHMTDSSQNDEDTQALIDRIAQLQQDKWLLEEKVHHLENTGSALAEDVLQKSTIIQHYYMENKADHAHSSGHFAASPQGKMRLVPWANKGSSKDNVMAEVNRKMQRALEEALMKNIHLQKDVDMLSAELQKQPNSEPS